MAPHWRVPAVAPWVRPPTLSSERLSMQLVTLLRLLVLQLVLYQCMCNDAPPGHHGPFPEQSLITGKASLKSS